MGLGYRIIFSGTTSIHYSGVVNIIAATAVTIHLSFGLNENENQQDIIGNSVAQKSKESQMERVMLETRLGLHPLI